MRTRKGLFCAAFLAVLTLSFTACRQANYGREETAGGPPGSLDPSFGGTGIVTGPTGSSNYIRCDVAIQPDGRIVAAGDVYNGSDLDISLVRYNTDGTLDTAFGTGGRVTTDIDSSSDWERGMAIQPDGRIVVAGIISHPGSFPDNPDDPDGYIPPTSEVVLLRYTADGALDETFGTGGIVRTSFGADQDEATGVAVQADGKIVVAGGSSQKYAAARFDTEGTLDASFGTGGVVTTRIETLSGGAKCVAIQPDGGIVLAGYVFNNPGYKIAVVRYTPDGEPDPDFGTNGVVTTQISGFDDEAYGVTVQSDGRIVVAGSAWDDFGEPFDFALVRYNMDGTLDASFGTGGTVRTNFDSSFAVAYCVTVQPDGKIIAAGEASNGSSYAFAIARYDRGGSLDEGFGTGGFVTTPIGASNDQAHSFAIQANGGIVAAGFSYNGSAFDYAIARYLP